MTALDTFLSWAIPILVLFFFAALLYPKFKEPIGVMAGWIKSMFTPSEPVIERSIGYE